MAGGNYDRSQKKGQLNPAVSYNFGLQVEAAFFVPLRSVRVFTKENEFDYYQEGGLNDYVHMLRKPISKPFTFQVERYVGTDAGMFDANSGFLDPLALGTDLILPVILYVNRAQTKNAGQNFSMDNCARAYIFTGCTVTAKEYGELNAESSKLLTETTTIAYKELFAINQWNPADERGGVWKFKEKDYLGEGESHKENRSKNDSKKTQMSTADNTRWQIKKDDFKGNAKRHIPTIDHTVVNDTKAQSEKKAKDNRWSWDKAHPKGTGKRHIPTVDNTKPNDTKAQGEEKGAKNKWIIDKDHPKGGGKDHSENRSKNDPKSKGESAGKDKMWEIDKDKYTGNSKFHTDERGRKNDPKSKGETDGKSKMWQIDKDNYAGNSQYHTDERARKNDPKSKGESTGKDKMWEIDKDNYAGNSKYHTDERGRKNESKSQGESSGKSNTWVYDGSVNGSGKSHTENRNTNQKPDPVIWPPTRRALMAQALSDRK